MLVGIDVGGTFTDAVAIDGSTIHAVKTLTTKNQADGVLAILKTLLSRTEVEASTIRLAHGSTTATNALLERKGARTAAVLSEGFTDTLAIARQTRPELYRPAVARTAPLVDTDRIVGYEKSSAVNEIVLALMTLKVESVAISLVRAYKDSAEEQELAQAIREALPNICVVAATDISAEMREYERTSTAVIDAFLTPKVAPYLEDLGSRLREMNVESPLMMQSNGGLGTLDDARAHAARLVLSGPAGGLIAAQQICRELGFDELICMDVGGTSCDVALVSHGDLPRSSDREVGGFPIQLGMVDIHTVGAGASSIVWVDDAGSLQVGPHSAGSNPGPVAYGNGGDAPTITDCHVVLGNLAPKSLSHWDVELDANAATQAVESLLPKSPAESIADGAIAIASTHMAEAVGAITISRGISPSNIRLLAYGGAGGLHACAIAEALGTDTVVIPQLGGVLSAAGLAVAPERYETSRSVLLRPAEDPQAVIEVAGWIESLDANEIICEIRYVGQTHTLTVSHVFDSSLNEVVAATALLGCATRFVEEYARQFEYTLDAPIEIATIRCCTVIPAPRHPLIKHGLISTQRIASITRRNGDRGNVIDLPNGAVVVPNSWHLDTVTATCIVLKKLGDQ